MNVPFKGVHLLDCNPDHNLDRKPDCDSDCNPDNFAPCKRGITVFIGIFTSWICQMYKDTIKYCNQMQYPGMPREGSNIKSEIEYEILLENVIFYAHEFFYEHLICL